MDLLTQFEDDIARLASTEFTVEDLQAEDVAEAEAAQAGANAIALDDSIRSAQTMAYVPPNQFIIYLGGATSLAEEMDDAESSESKDSQNTQVNDSYSDDDGDES